MIKRLGNQLLIVAILSAALILPACSPHQAVFDISISPNSPQMVDPGGQVGPFIATVTNAPNGNTAVQWTINPPGIGTLVTTNTTATYTAPASITGTTSLTLSASSPIQPALAPSVTINLVPGPTISSALPSTGTVGQMYSGTVTVTGGIAPYTWTISGLPTGIPTPSGTSSTLTVSGTPTAAGNFTIAVSLKDSAGASSNMLNVPVVINPAPQQLTVAAQTLASGMVGATYGPSSITATGGTPPYTFSTAPVTGALPPGLSISPDGTVSGTVSNTATAQTYTFTVSVSDSETPPANATSGTITIVIANASVCTPLGNEYQLPAGDSLAFELQGYTNLAGTPSPFALVGSFTVDGNGNVTAGEIDVNSTASSPGTFQVNPTGSCYSLGPDHRGFLNLVYQNPQAAVKTSTKGFHPAQSAISTSDLPFQFRFALGESNGVISGRIIEFDATQGDNTATAGPIALQAVPASGSAPVGSGNFAIGLNGWDNALPTALYPFSFAGTFNYNSASNPNLSNGYADIGDANPATFNGGAQELGPASGTFSATTDASGRATITSFTYMFEGQPVTYDFAIYVISPTDFYAISTDTADATHPLVSGEAVGATSSFAGLSAANALNGGYAEFTQGLDSSSHFDLTLASFIITGTALTGTQLENDDSILTTTPINTGNGGYSVDGNGRMTFPTIANAPAIYLANPGTGTVYGFVVGLNGFYGRFEPGVTPGTMYSNDSLSPPYVFGGEQDIANEFGNISGATVQGSSAGTLTSTLDAIALHSGTIYYTGVSDTPTVNVNSDGTGTWVDNDLGNFQLITNGTVIYLIPDNGNGFPFLITLRP